MLIECDHKLVFYGFRDCLDCFEAFIQYFIWVLSDCLESEVHFGIRGMWDRIPDKFYVAVPWENNSEYVSKGMVLILENICCTFTIIFFLHFLSNFTFCITNLCWFSNATCWFSSSIEELSDWYCSSSSSDIIRSESDISTLLNYKYYSRNQ